jgi:trehalose 6-phosphate phosphatase
LRFQRRSSSHMRILTKGINLADFFARFPETSERLLVLDYDGTIAPFRIDRAQAYPYPGITDSIESIMRAERSRVVIISGRKIGEIVELLNMNALPELWGSHGWERMKPGGRVTSLRPGEEEIRGLDEADRFLSDSNVSSKSERKPGSIALHWRGLSDSEANSLRTMVLNRWREIAESSGLYVADFDGGLELRAPGCDKGRALENVLADSPGDSIAAYLGDDKTDEDAFRVLGRRGLGILVNAELRPTAADIWIKPPDELYDFLSRWARACGGDE